MLKMTPLDQFNRSLKPDPTAFPALGKDIEHCRWKSSFETQACAQGLQSPLNLSCKPTDAEGAALLQHHSECMFAILQPRVKTSRGSSIVKSNLDKRNTQKVWAQMEDCCTRAWPADDGLQHLKAFIQSTRLGIAHGKHAWSGAPGTCLLSFQEAAQQHQDCIPKPERFSGDQLAQHLCRGVELVSPLSAACGSAHNLSKVCTNFTFWLACETHMDQLMGVACTNGKNHSTINWSWQVCFSNASTAALSSAEDVAPQVSSGRGAGTSPGRNLGKPRPLHNILLTRVALPLWHCQSAGSTSPQLGPQSPHWGASPSAQAQGRPAKARSNGIWISSLC